MQVGEEGKGEEKKKVTKCGGGVIAATESSTWGCGD